MYPINNPSKAILSNFGQREESEAQFLEKGKAAAEGEIRTWNGQKMKKQGKTWVPVTGDNKGKQEEPGKEGTKQPPVHSSHLVGQFTHMKSIMDSDPKKAYEIYQKLDPEHQKMIPQEVVNKMIAGAHKKEEKEEIDYNSLGKSKKSDSTKKAEGAEKELGVHQTKDTTSEDVANRVSKVITSVEDNKMFQEETNKALQRLGVDTFTSKEYATAQSFALDVVESRKKRVKDAEKKLSLDSKKK